MTLSGVSDSAPFAQNIIDALLEEAKKVRPLQRVERDQKELLNSIRKSAGCPEGEPEISFETIEVMVSRGVLLGECRVAYSPYTRIFMFEGIPDGDQLERMVEVSNDLTLRKLKTELEGLSGFTFQRAIAEILRNLPWVKRVDVRRLTGDDGIDFDATYFLPEIGELTVAGQVKRSNIPTGPEDMRAFVGSLVLKSPRPNMGVFVSLSGYSPGAEAAAKSASNRIGVKVQTHTITDILHWMKGNGIGVTKRTLEVEDVDPTFWKELTDGRA